jgi:FtsZ-binding cell division protein ZapB
MKKRVIATASIGRHEELFSLAQSNLEQYAELHNYEISNCYGSLDPNRPVAWTKILHILKLMKHYEEIFWIDADAIILEATVDISSIVEDKCDLAWVYHEYQNQSHPNSGVMFIRVNAATNRLFELANQQRDLDNHPWWDQAALMRVLGIESSFLPIGKLEDTHPIRISEQKLGKEWNSIRQDAARHPKIRHFAGDPIWLRELLMAEYANPSGNASDTLNLLVSRINQNLELNESLRQEKESLRQESESLRQESESLRQESESLRQEKESLRQEKESLRQESESLRQESESLRQESESLRQENESLRQEKESLRQENESLRQENESLRQENESLRQESESLRQTISTVLNSRIWKLFSFWRSARIRGTQFSKSLRRDREIN